MDLASASKITECKNITIDEAKRKLKLGGKKAEAFETKVIERQDGQFNQLMSVIFGWKIQEDGSKKMVSRLACGKILFPDKSEDTDSIYPGIPYICLVYEPIENPDGTQAKQAYAKIICEEYTPIIYIPGSKAPVMVWVDENGKRRNKVPHGNSYTERIMELLNIAEKSGWTSIKVVFRCNEKN